MIFTKVVEIIKKALFYYSLLSVRIRND